MQADAPELPDRADWPWRRGESNPAPILFAYSPQILPAPPDWPHFAHVTGYWQLPPEPRWHPPPALVEFLVSGPPPVYFGMGSFQSAGPVRLIRKTSVIPHHVGAGMTGSAAASSVPSAAIPLSADQYF